MKHANISKPRFSQAEIGAAIAAAPEVATANADNPPTTDFDWENAIVSHSLPELQEKLAARRRGPGKKPARVAIQLRLPPEVLEAWKATGPGWQTRMAEDLQKNAPR
ncbi:MAG: BrnA antitoxin family protein [Betaproteobacteria bacterium]|nr:BrnA antitoxin family protein [Betaproteobacteria bacterium]